MTEQDLDDPDVSAALQKVGGKAMPKRVGRHTLADPGTLPCGATSRLKSAEAHMIAGLLARPEVALVHLRNVGYGCYNFAVGAVRVNGG